MTDAVLEIIKRIPFLKEVKEFTCGECGKKYKRVQFEEICREVGKEGVKYPPYEDLLKCMSCFRKKYSIGLKGE